MATQDRSRPLPKFGEWDVKNPASAEGFTVIFSRARDEKKKGTAKRGNVVPPQRKMSNQKPKEDQHLHHHHHHHHHLSMRKWLCCA